MSPNFFVVSLFIAMFSFQIQDPALHYDNYAINKTLERADFDFANYMMYRDQKSWIGKTIAVYGTYVSKPVIVSESREYIQVTGRSNSGEPANLVIFLDSPLPTIKGFEDKTHTLSKGQLIRVFGILQRCRDFVDWNGDVRYLPTLDGLLIYDVDDKTYQYPLWVSKTLRRGN